MGPYKVGSKKKFGWKYLVILKMPKKKKYEHKHLEASPLL